MVQAPGAGGEPAEKLFAFTTRSRLKGPWFFPHMLYATLRVRRQLKKTGDVVEHISEPSRGR